MRVSTPQDRSAGLHRSRGRAPAYAGPHIHKAPAACANATDRPRRIERLETFLLELGGDFTFVGRQRRLRLHGEWFRVDLLMFNRRLRCLVLIDLKIGSLAHADAGQMHMLLNYAREHWTLPGENPPVGLILCAHKGAALARYAPEGLPNKGLAAEYRTVLPDEAVLVAELDKTRLLLDSVKPRRKQ